MSIESVRNVPSSRISVRISPTLSRSESPSSGLARSIVTKTVKGSIGNPTKTLLLWALLIALMAGVYALVRE